MMALPVPVEHVAAPELAGQVTAYNPYTHSCCQPTNYLMIPVFQTPQPPPPYPHTIPTTSSTTTGITKNNGETEKIQCQNQTVHDDSVNSSGGAGFAPRHVFKSKGSPRSSPRSSSSISPCSRQNLEYVSPGNMGNAVLQEPHQPGVRREYKRSRALTDKWFALQRRANEQVQRNRQIPKKTMTIPFDPRKWTPKDVHTWLFYTINMNDIEDVDFSYFVMNGQGLCILKESNFLYRVPNPGGKILFRDLRLRLWRCLKTEKAIKNGYRMHESDSGERVGANPLGSNPGHGVQSQQERSQQPLNFSAPRSAPLGATNSHDASPNLPEMDRRHNARHAAYSGATQTTQSPLRIIDPHFAQRHSELDQRSVPRHYVPQTTKNHFQNLVHISNSQSALNLTAPNPREGNPIDKLYHQRFQSPLNFTLPPNPSGLNEAGNLRNSRHLINQSHQQRFPGPLDFSVSPKLSGSIGGANLSHNPQQTAQQRFQGPLNFTIPPKPSGPSRENLRHYPHETDKLKSHQKTPQQSFQGPLNFTVPARPPGPDQRDNLRHVPLKTDNPYQKTHQQRFQGPLNFTVPPNSSSPHQRESSRNVLHPKLTDKTQHHQRVQDALNFTVPSNQSAPDHRENSRLVTHPVSHPYQSPANVSRSYVTSNLAIRENLRHLEKHQFKHPAKNNSFDRHSGSVNKAYNPADKVPTFQTPWDYNLRQIFAQEEHLIKSQHGSRISTLGSHPEFAIERTRKSSTKRKPRKNCKRPAAEGDSPGSTDLKEVKPIFQRSDSCPVSNDSKYPTCDYMDQTTVKNSTSESNRTESDDETGQKLQEVEHLSQTTSTVIFQRSNSNPELNDSPKDKKTDVLALQRSDSHPGALSPRRADHSDLHPGALSPRRVDHSDSHPGALSPRHVAHSDSHPGALSPTRVYHSESHPGALNSTRVDQSADRDIFPLHNWKHSGNKELAANLSELNSNSRSISPEPNHRKDQLIPDSNHDTGSEHIVVKTEEIPTLEHCSEIYSQNSELTSNHGNVDLPTLTPEPCHVGIPVFDPSHRQVGLPGTPEYGHANLPVGPVVLPVKVKREPDDDHNFSQGSSCSYACVEDKQSKMETEQFVCKLENEYSIAAEYKKV